MGVHKYICYGLNIESAFPLLGVQSGWDERFPIVSINYARPGVNRAELVNRSDHGDFLLGHLKGVLHFWIEDGRSITMMPSRDANPEEAEFLIRSMSAGFALALLLRQRGLLTLHASVLHKDGCAIAFLGDSGWGKSTLAEYFSQNGYEVLSDDVGALRISSEEISVVPGNSLVKLRGRAVKSLLPKNALSSRKLDGRIHLSKPVSASTEVPLSRLYILQPEFSETVRLQPLRPQELIMSLMRHTHGTHLLTRPDYQKTLLHQCSEVSRRIPTFILHRKQGIEFMGSILEKVEANL